MALATDTRTSSMGPYTELPGSRRTDFLDRIRLVLTGLVILHHSAIMFGAQGGWYLHFPTGSLAERVLLTMFVSLNQAFFMGFFFLLAGYFSVPSYERKGALPFLRDRLVRLGIPLVVFGYVLGPMTVALAATGRGLPFFETWGALTRDGEFDIGPLWFAWALLLFSLAYAAWRLIPRASAGAGIVPRHVHLLAAAVVTGALAFLLRLWVPVGQQRWMLQIGYFSSYLVLFGAGCATARSRWLERIDSATARPWCIVAAICAPLLYVYGIVVGVVHHAPFDTSGGWTLPALAYAFWEPFVAWGIMLGMLWRFRVGQAKRAAWQKWSGCAYAAYILHPPVVVALGLLLAPAPLPNSLRFLIAGTGGILLSFLLARLALYIPGAGRVL